MQTFVQAVSILFIFGISWWIWKQDTTKMKKFFWPALGAKLSAGILVGIVYAAAYSRADTFNFFDYALQLSANAKADFWAYLNFLIKPSTEYFSGEDRTIFFVKITSIFALISFDNYWICSIYFSWFSFLAAWKLTKFIWVKIPNTGIAAAIAFLFFPSCVFWASGILKESIVMAALFYLARLFLMVWLKEKISWIHIVWTILAIWVAWNLKYYYIGLFVPVIATTLVSRKIIEAYKIKGLIKEYSVWFLLLAISIVAASFLHPNFSFQRVANVIVQNHNAIVQFSDPDDVIHFYDLTGTWSSIATNIPLAFISGFFRPFIWEANTFFKTIVSIENLTLLIISVPSFRSFIKTGNGQYRLPVLAVIVYSLMLCLFLALWCPNFGTLVRLRIGFLPFLVLILVNQPVFIRPLSRLFNVPFNNLAR